MLSIRAGLSLTLLLALTAYPVFASHTHHAPTGRHFSMSRIHKGKAKKATLKGQRQIDPERASQIQEALIHENYLSGSPTGQWDAESQQAMQRYQSDHGWQTKIMPDSRALIKLGLGPAQTDVAASAGAKSEMTRPIAPARIGDDPNSLVTAHESGR